MAVTSAKQSGAFPVPVFVAAGTERWGEVQELRGRSDLRLVTSPRHATVLVVAGPILPEQHDALLRVHDQLPHPRGVIVLDADPTPFPADTPRSPRDVDAVARSARAVFDVVTSDPAASTHDMLPDREPNEWRGIGPFGQGGEGMMGGTPYGRSMAMTGDDRDGLALDQLHLRLGPFLDALPGAMTLHLVLQGEVVQQAEFEHDPAPTAGPGDQAGGPARSGLQWLAHALHVQGLDAQAARAARFALQLGRAGSTDERGSSRSGECGSELRRLRRSLRWTGLRTSLRGVGMIGGRDAWDRWTTNLDAIARQLDGESADELVDWPDAIGLADALVGSTWTDALTTIVSVGPLAIHHARRAPA